MNAPVGARARALAVLASVALAGGCGGEDEKDVVVVPPDPFAGEVGEGVKRVDGRFSVDQVIDAYHREIGLNLRIDERVPGQYVALTTLPGPPFAPIAPDLGLFSIYVTGSEEQAQAFIGNPGIGEQSTTREPGIRFVADSTLVSAKARLGNVVLDWNADDLQQTDERFQRLAAPLEYLGGERPNRPAMNPCVKEQTTKVVSAAGGDPTCRLGPQVITFASSDEELEFGDLTVSQTEDPEFVQVLENEREDLTVGPDPPKPPQPIRAKGLFMIVRLDVENHGEEPVESLRTSLLADGRLHHQDFRNAFYVDKTNSPFPLDGGDSGTEVLLFDVPFRVARSLPSKDPEDGSLVIVDPRDTQSLHVPGSAPTVARLRLFD
jgi:hypothetical protein